MLRSKEVLAAQGSQEDQGTSMALIDIQRDAISFKEQNTAFAQTQEMLMRGPQYSQPSQKAQTVCNSPRQIIDL